MFVLFLKAFSWGKLIFALVTLGDDMVKQMQNWEGKLYLTENLLSRNEMWFVVTYSGT